MQLSTQAQQWTCGNEDDVIPENGMLELTCTSNSQAYHQIYENLEFWIPNEDTPIKTLHVNFNIWQRADGTGNLQNNPDDIDRLNEIAGLINDRMGTVNPNPDPPISYGILGIVDSKIRIVLDSIYFYQDTTPDSSYYYSTGGSIDTYQSYLNNNFPERTKALNIFFSNGYLYYEGDGAAGYCDMSGTGDIQTYDHGQQGIWFMGSNHLPHELGHTFFLWHTYQRSPNNCLLYSSNFFYDVYDTTNYNCEDYCYEPCCPTCDICYYDGGACNNLMGGGSNPYISPLQMGVMHRRTVLHDKHMARHVTGYSSVPYQITQDEIWDFSIKFYQDIIVKAGNTLTVQCEVKMVSSAKIIVEQGAKLIIDGGIITNEFYYDQPWQGIQVWGNKNAHQFSDTAGNYQQGYLELKNGATIENAIVAVNLWEPENWASTGGIVHVIGGTSEEDKVVFRNNTKSVHALHYNNFLPVDSTREVDYNSYFKNCIFEITEDYLGTETFYKHVDMAHVKGINFYACDFSLADSVTNVSDYSHAIAGYDAQFRVKAICNSQQQPCPETDYEKCTFNGFWSAINAINDGSSPVTFNVSRAHFTDNAYGVRTRMIDKFSVLFSDFEIGEFYGCGRGIFLEHSEGFAIEENQFTKHQGAPSANYFGIHVKDCPSQNEIYKNEFFGISYANYSEGKNWDLYNVYEGLSYFCNDNTNNYADFYVAEMPISGIQTNQGSYENVTGNTFSSQGNTWHFFNGGNHHVDYYFCTGCDNEVPVEDKLYHVEDHNRYAANTCPSHYGGDPKFQITLTPQQRIYAETTYYDNLTDYDNVIVLYDSYIDGGDTDSKLLDIQTAQPDDMWALRSQLLGDSPHLSFEVLKEVADKTDVFTESALFDILAANPDELKKDTLLSYLENKEEPLPDYMIDILRQLAGGTTYKTTLQQQMARYNRNKTRAANDIIRSILNDSVTDYVDLRDWLDNLGGFESDRQIITTYIHEGNFSDALTLANMLPQLYDLEGGEITEHNYYLDMISLFQTLYLQNRNTYQLDSTEFSTIVLIADSSTSVAGTQAKSILEAVYNFDYTSCPQVNGSTGHKNSNININNLGIAYGMEITVKPNPAKQWAAFDYTLPEGETSATITISNITGKIVEILDVDGKQGQKLWDTRRLQSGIYIYTIKAGGFSQSGKIIISK